MRTPNRLLEHKLRRVIKIITNTTWRYATRISWSSRLRVPTEDSNELLQQSMKLSMNDHVSAGLRHLCIVSRMPSCANVDAITAPCPDSPLSHVQSPDYWHCPPHGWWCGHAERLVVGYCGGGRLRRGRRVLIHSNWWRLGLIVAWLESKINRMILSYR